MSRANIRVTSTTNIGPLTTPYRPPDECITELYVAQSYDTTKVLFSGYVQSDCKPSGYASAYAKQLNPVMSPGNSCPYAYLAACTYTGESVTFASSNQTAAPWDALAPFEIAVGCCPFGYSCGPSPYGCTLQMDAGTTKATPIGTNAPPVTITIDSTTRGGATALGVIYVSQQSGHSSLPTKTASPSRDSSSSSDTSSSSDSGLSIGAKAGIGIGSAAAFLLLSMAIFMILRYRKAFKKSTVPRDGEAQPYHGEPYAGQDHAVHNEPPPAFTAHHATAAAAAATAGYPNEKYPMIPEDSVVVYSNEKKEEDGSLDNEISELDGIDGVTSGRISELPAETNRTSWMRSVYSVELDTEKPLPKRPDEDQDDEQPKDDEVYEVGS